MGNLFEKATREKYRFASSKGDLTVEELWDLPLSSAKGVDLDTVAQKVYKEVKDSEEVSFVKGSNPASTLLKAKLEVVKYIIDVKLLENEQRRIAADKKEQIDNIRRLISDKKAADLAGQSIEDLEKKLSELLV